MMQHQMVPPTRGVQFEADAPDLLQQMARLLPAAILREAKNAHGVLDQISRMPLQEQVDAVDKLGVNRVIEFDRGADAEVTTSTTIAVCAAALATASKQDRSLTVSGRVQAAKEILSDRFQADW